MPTTLEQSQYGFDRNSRRSWQRRALSTTQDQQYNYDALGQVSAAARGSLNLNKTAISGRPASAETWDYDPTGNWRGYHTAAAGTSTLDQHRVHDRGNRLTQIEGNPHNMILDRVGRMRQMAPDAEGDWDGKLEVTWDAWSRITRVKNNGEVAGEYTYDGTHRRVTREVDNETLHSYYNDAWRPVEERKNTETTANISYLWGARHRDDLVRRDRAVGGTTLNETRYVLMDYFNPAAITDASGVVKERYAFSAFGVRTILNPDFTVGSSSECGMEFAFQGQFLDVESGLMNYGYRYYSPQLGRWTCKDPIGVQGGINLYEMAENNAFNAVDYLGLLQIKLREATPFTAGKCGEFKWGVEFSLDDPTAKGYFVQDLQIEWEITNCSGQSCTSQRLRKSLGRRYDWMSGGDDKSRWDLDNVMGNNGSTLHYLEGFPYPGQGKWPIDTFGFGDQGACTKGKMKVEGRVSFFNNIPIGQYPGPNPDGSKPKPPTNQFLVNHPQTLANSIPSMPMAPGGAYPNMGQRQAESVRHSIEITWDCTYNANGGLRQNTQLTPGSKMP